MTAMLHLTLVNIWTIPAIDIVASPVIPRLANTPKSPNCISAGCIWLTVVSAKNAFIDIGASWSHSVVPGATITPIRTYGIYACQLRRMTVLKPVKPAFVPVFACVIPKDARLQPKKSYPAFTGEWTRCVYAVGARPTLPVTSARTFIQIWKKKQLNNNCLTFRQKKDCAWACYGWQTPNENICRSQSKNQ